MRRPLNGSAPSISVAGGLEDELRRHHLPRVLTLRDAFRFPVAAFARAWAHRRTYFVAWWILLLAILLSFLGLLALGMGFLFTSVWAWDVVGYAFTVAMYNDE